MGIPLEILSLLISIFLNNNIDYEENSAESRDRQELYFKVARYVTMNEVVLYVQSLEFNKDSVDNSIRVWE